MDFTEALVAKYAKRIFGFAYSKTHNQYDAEDLSQEIIIQLCDSRFAFKEIENMDAYIYNICCHVWSNFYRKNKPQWEALNCPAAFDTAVSSENIEQSYMQKELLGKLRQEIMYLGKMRRDITIMFYYENKSGDEISRLLGIPASTVRWHLSESKKVLKERIEMSDKTVIYKPIELSIGHNGWVKNYDMDGLNNDLLVQNICWICYGKPLTIEEIAQTMGVAAFYLEPKIERLLYMDYIKKIGANKYQTNFFIRDYDYYLVNQKISYENALSLALPIYNLLKNNLEKIKSFDFIGNNFNDNFLMWCFLPSLINIITYESLVKFINDNNLQHYTPKRKDGTEHWVSASTQFWFKVKSNISLDPDFKDFCENSSGNGIKTRSDQNVYSLQYDLLLFGGWRVFEVEDLRQLKRVYDIIVKKELPNEYDKIAISNMVEKGYVKVTDGIPEILVPYLPGNYLQIKDLLLSEKNNYIDIDEMQNPLKKHFETAKKYIPDFLEENEKKYLLASFWPQYAMLYMLLKHGYLSMPTDDEKKRICTLVWEE